MSAEQIRASESLIGKPAGEVVVELARLHPRIKTFVFARYFPNDNDEPDLFWHFSRDDVLDGLQWLTSPELQTQDSLIGFTSLLELEPEPSPSPKIIRISHEWAQLPILYLIPEGKDVKKFLKEDLGQKSGWIIDAPPGCYYCGLQLLTPGEWSQFMERARSEGVRSGMIPEKYLNLSIMPKIVRQTSTWTMSVGLAQPYSLLRISTGPLNPQETKVIDVL